MTALRFFFSITLDRHNRLTPLFRVVQPQKLPTVQTYEETWQNGFAASQIR
jgi:hypothetical protein